MAMARWSPFLVFDYPVQKIDPVWSPDETVMLFGDGEFGLEIIIMPEGEKKWLAGPGQDLYHPQWSPSGNWIAAEKSTGREMGDYAVLITPDGEYIAYSNSCDRLIFDMKWAPSDDRLAFLCKTWGSDKCVEGEPCECIEMESEKYSLWIWDVND
jgi:hypothetical protein